MSFFPSLSFLHPHQMDPSNASHDSTLEMTAPVPLTITVPCIRIFPGEVNFPSPNGH